MPKGTHSAAGLGGREGSSIRSPPVKTAALVSAAGRTVMLYGGEIRFSSPINSAWYIEVNQIDNQKEGEHT